jgi:hypothetical protein
MISARSVASATGDALEMRERHLPRLPKGLDYWRYIAA